MAGPSDKPEFPPLLPIGRHERSVADIQQLCVENFPLSTTRREIMDGLVKLIDRLNEHAIEGELWIDGSFLTEKIEADDCDLILRLHGEFVDSATPEQLAVMRWVADNLRDELRCHSFAFAEYDESHPKYWDGHYMYCYWMKQWGYSRDEDAKGIAVVKLLGSIPEKLKPIENTDDPEQGEHQ